MKIARQSFLNSVEAICKRPHMYTNSGSFFEVLALIQGIALGSGVHGMQGSHAGIQDFFHWLERKVGVHPEFEWFSIESFYAMYPDDESVSKDFARYYRKFCEELPEEEDEIGLKITEAEAQQLFNFLGQEEKFIGIQQEIKKQLEINLNEREFLSSKHNVHE